MSSLPAPRLISTPKHTGYYLSDINDALTQERRRAFHKWFAKRTGVLHNGRMLVHATDWERFLCFDWKDIDGEEADAG